MDRDEIMRRMGFDFAEHADRLRSIAELNRDGQSREVARRLAVAIDMVVGPGHNEPALWPADSVPARLIAATERVAELEAEVRGARCEAEIWAGRHRKVAINRGNLEAEVERLKLALGLAHDDLRAEIQRNSLLDAQIARLKAALEAANADVAARIAEAERLEDRVARQQAEIGAIRMSLRLANDEVDRQAGLIEGLERQVAKLRDDARDSGWRGRDEARSAQP